MIIDRFEGGFAVCELDNGEMADIPRERLPADAKEGSVLKEIDGALVLDAGEAERRRARIRALEDSLFE